MSRRKFLPILSILFVCGTSAVSAKAPTEPSNLRVKPLGVNSFLLEWKDNSDNELGWEIRVALKGGELRRYQLVASPNITSYTVITNELPGKELEFQMTAYNGVAGKEKLSKPTSIVAVKALTLSTFEIPKRLKAAAIDDGQIRLTWKDQATSENGYQMQVKEGTAKKWVTLGNVNPGTTFRLPITDVLLPATNYSFRVRAYKGNPIKFTGFSNVTTTTTKPFQAPANLVATTGGDGAFSFAWKDKSSIESGFELQFKGSTGDFQPLDPYAANTTSVPNVTGADLNTTYQFRVRSIRVVGTTTVYSGFSNTVSIKSSTLTKPTNVAATAASDSSFTVTWKDATTRESGYQIQYREAGTTGEFTSATVASNIQTYTATKLDPGKLYEIRVSAILSDFFGNLTATSATTTVQVRTKDGIGGDLNPPIFWNTSFVYQIEVSRLSALSNLTVTGVPAGLVYNSGTRTITGTATADGVKTLTLTATFNGSPTVTRSLVLRIIRPPADPVVAQAFTPVNVAAAANSVVSVTGKFSDPDTLSAARVATTKGTFDIILYSLATPLTVDNFLDYVDAGRYDDSFFNRSVADFVIQGGGFKYTSAAGFTAVPKFAAIQNEPGISNLKGTVAMAKQENNPNSATSEFFVNVSDTNAPKLDPQNEGFTVFGRVPDAGMIFVNAINDLPTKAYSISPLPSAASDSVPMDASEAPKFMEPAKLVKINSVTAAPILTYGVVSQNPAVATASVAGTNVTITGVAAGSTTIQVTATDLDGRSVTQDIAVTVPVP